MTVDDPLVIDGVTLEARWLGPGPTEAPTIVMLHEGLGSVAQWGELPAQLAAAAGCGVFLYSRAGYGASDGISLPRSLGYMHDEALRTLPKVLDAIGFERGILLGHSDGASIAAIYAGTLRDDRVRGLVLIAPHFFVEAIALAGIADAQAAYESGHLRDRLARYHGANVDTAFWGWNRAWLDPDFARWDIQDLIGSISVPMLIVQGADDQYATVAQVEAAQRQATVPVEVALISGARHAPHRQQPARMLALMTDFVSALVQPSGESGPLSSQSAGGVP